MARSWHHRPNGAGKTTLLNASAGSTTRTRDGSRSKARTDAPAAADVAALGIARTFRTSPVQGMSVLDNIMTGDC